MPRFVPKLWLIAVCMAAAGGAALGVALIYWPPPIPDAPSTQPIQLPLLRKGFPALSMELPVMRNPVLVPAAETDLEDEAVVIGIVVNGEARAYLREAFELLPEHHVVADTIQSRSIAVTHCDFQRCTRVLAASQPDQPLDIRIGGWRDDQTMELIVDGRKFSQKSADIPLAEIPSSETTWGQWRKEHPDTLVYLGDTR